jgi:hypothetical protein
VENQEKQPYFSNRYTNCEAFRHFVNEKLSQKVPLKTEENIEAALTLTTPYNGLAGTQSLNIQTYPLLPTTLS